MPDDSLDCCKALIPSQSVRMSPADEDEMVTFAINRLDHHRNQMGWEKGGGFRRDTWLWKRHVATRMFEGDFKHRAVAGSIFERVNLTLNMCAQFIEQHKSRITDDLLGSERFFGVVPEGPEDQHPVLQDVEHILHDVSGRLNLQDKFKLATLAALVRGEMVPKITRQVKRVVTVRLARVQMSMGMPARDSRGGLITNLDQWVPVPDNPMLKMLARDPRVQMEAKATPIYAMEEMELPVTLSQQAGCDFEFPYWSDMVVPVTATSLDASEMLGHCFMKAVPDLMDLLPEGAQMTPMAKAYLDATRGRSDGAEKTENNRAAEHRGEEEDKQEADDDRGYTERRYDEIYFRYDWRRNGRYEHLVLLVDREARWPIYYGQAAEIMPWTTKHHPFSQPFRINPIEDRWYGRGYYEKYGDSSLFVDKCWCRIELELQKSGNLIVENREATEQGRAGKPIRFRTTETLQVSGQARPEDAVHVVVVKPQVEGIEQSMETMLQKMQSDAGVTSPGDAASAGMNAADTLGGMQILEQQKSTALREREGELLTGMNGALQAIAEVELHAPDIQRIARLLDAKKGAGAPMPQVVAAKGATGGLPPDAAEKSMQPGAPAAPEAVMAPPPGMPMGPPPEMLLNGAQRAERLVAWARTHSKELANVIKLYVTRSRQAKLHETCTKIIQIVDKWLSYPPQVRPNLYDTFADMLRALDVPNPDQLLGPKNPPLMPMAGGMPGAAPGPAAPPQPPMAQAA